MEYIPGPWVVAPPNQQLHDYEIAIFSGDYWVASVFTENPVDVDNKERATARLIAAAPDLQEIASKLVEWEQDPDHYGGDLADLACIARKVLEKIEKGD